MRPLLFGPRFAAHPRLRGEDDSPNINALTFGGSPPPARGGHPAQFDDDDRERLTPACAGTTMTAPVQVGPSPAHPRLRGEDFSAAYTSALTSGSPPPARGGPARPETAHRPWRLTPACAGRTPRGSHPWSRPPAHPRLRGEDAGTYNSFGTGNGSPPPARGGPHVTRAQYERYRLTPACAGRTRPAPHLPGCGPAHPRLRGEDSGPQAEMHLGTGSPPPARGGRLRDPAARARGRLTPACAGRTR
ncbi:hypothetical protein OK006_7390 [Actinobacteria bacterium OK006]|nr:hypothetical protein OK006_7390 [Actinobacteria bacterium OK006]